jgi:hypothetical protein
MLHSVTTVTHLDLHHPVDVWVDPRAWTTGTAERRSAVFDGPAAP